MRIHRLCSARHAARAFDGEGARLHGGRWNPPGVAVVYASGSLALAMLEALAGFDRRHAPTDHVWIAADVPDDIAITRIDERSLPADWRAHPAPHALAEIGRAWHARHESAILQVPSALVPGEHNLLLDPTHPDMARVRIGAPQPISFDARLGG